MSAVAGPPQADPALAAIASEPPRRGWWMTRRFLAAAVSIVLISGGATATVALNEVGKVVDALAQNKPVKIAPKVLAPTSKGTPETLLLVGNDQRPAPKDNPNGFVIPHSNEMLLVRIDPSKPTVSMLSIPRELQVAIYPHGAEPVVTRINAAYGIGGAELMTETIKRVLGISVNHVFVLTFPNFRRAVDELGCVYMGVDRRYYHVNEPGGEQYFEINLQPGYQRLCGMEALEFVANRHEDTSLTRDARDQRFLLEVKAQYGASLFENRERFERILGRTVETDLHGAGQVLDLLELLVESAGKPVRQVPFQVNLLPTYDTASEQQIHESVQSFLEGTAPIHRQALRSAGASHGHGSGGHAAGSGFALTPTSAAELDQARSQAPNLPFPLEYPRARDSYAGAGPDTLRLYDIRDEQGHLHPIYVVVVDRGELGQFYDVQGTNWSDPPLLGDPGQTVQVGARDYELFYAGEQVKAIAWREAGAVYWIENTLTDNVSPQAMLATAEQTVPVIRASGQGRVPTAASTAHAVTLRPDATTQTSLASRLEALGGLVGLGVVGLLALLVLSRQRELRRLREQVAHALVLEARQRPLFAAAGIPYAEPARATPVSAPAPVGPPAPVSAPGAPGGPGSAPTGEPAPTMAPTPTIYRARRRWRTGVLAGACVALAAALAALAFAILHSRSTAPRASSSLAVAVFNATPTPGAAHHIADMLRAGRVRVGTIGDINTSLGHGVFVLYPPGAGGEARQVARLIPSLAPTVTPIQPQVQVAVGREDEIVVVLD
jgi:polyisoprenyl-teichoic acid--peptidoglycan teichoic acid transferase